MFTVFILSWLLHFPRWNFFNSSHNFHSKYFSIVMHDIFDDKELLRSLNFWRWRNFHVFSVEPAIFDSSRFCVPILYPSFSAFGFKCINLHWTLSQSPSHKQIADTSTWSNKISDKLILLGIDYKFIIIYHISNIH